MSKMVIGKKALSSLEFAELWSKMKLTYREIYLPNGEKATYSSDDYTVSVDKYRVMVISNDLRQITVYDTINNMVMVVDHYQAREAETA